MPPTSSSLTLMTKPFNFFLYFLTAVIFLFAGFSARGNNYYFSNSTGNDSYTSLQAQNPSTPWKSIAKLNSFFSSIVAGDNIYFNRGDVFYGSIVITKSGTSSSLITIGAYGSGNKPLITGLNTLSSWSSAGGGIYQVYAPAVKNTVNLVTLNGIPTGVGRYPNSDAANGGYLKYESFSGTTSIIDNELTGATNWTGAEVVIRKQHYLMEKCRITNHSGSTITFTTTPSINPLNNSNPAPAGATAGFGYFIQRDPRTLDQLGEWYYNTSTKYLQMYFGSNDPSSYSIKVSTLDTLINIGKMNYININNIAFEGANIAGIYGAYTTNITIQSCDMNAIGGKGILIFDSQNLLIDGVTTNNILCGAIDATSRYHGNATVRNCNIKNTAVIAGMGSFWDDNDYKAISVTVTSGALIEKNIIDTTGFVGIQFQGNNVVIQNNFVNYFDFVKDDGGGIYTYQSGSDANPGTTYTSRTIQNNIVMNGIGAGAGTLGNVDVDGIFLDGRSSNVDILNNTSANIGVNGIYTNNSNNVNIRGNTCFNNGCGITISRYSWGSTKNLSITQNVFYPKFSSQINFSYGNGGINVPVVSTIQAAMQGIGLIDSNYYSTPSSNGFNYLYSLVEGGAYSYPKPLTFEGWRTMTNHDAASVIPPRFATYKLKSLTSSNTVTNGQFTSGISSVTTWSPAAINVITSWDNSGKINGGSLKITPVLPSTDYTLVYGVVGAVSSSKSYILRFTTVGTLPTGSLRAYIRKAASPQTVLTPVQVKNFGTAKTVHEFLFTAPTSEAMASFLIEIQQGSGATYIDDIAFYEADATPLNIDDQLRFEYNPTNIAKSIALDANYIGVDGASYSGTLTLQPFTSKILVKDTSNTVVPPQVKPVTSLQAAAVAAPIRCFGSNTIVAVTASEGSAPYRGTGSYSVNAGTGSLKISVTAPVPSTYTFLYSTIGSISSAKTYILRFSTVGTTSSGSLRASIRQTGSPYAYLTPTQPRTFGTTRVDHEFMFTAPKTEASASFFIELMQTSGTTYIDNIAFFEATSTGALISNNLYSSGQFESGSIKGITTWSATTNHLAQLDLSSKMTNTYYYPVTDASGSISTATVNIMQPSAVVASATSGTVTRSGGTTTIVVSATGGTAPYTGVGNYNGYRVGTYNFTVKDANGCSSVTTIVVKSGSTARAAGNGVAAINAIGVDSVAINSAGLLKINSFPNPTTTQFGLMVEGGTSEMVYITVMSIDGRVLYQTRGNTNNKYVFGNNFGTGIYVVKVMQGNTTRILKVLKEK